MPTGEGLTANQIVAANLRRAREQHGMTQTDVANRLSELTGRSYTKATISAMERSADGGKRRLFDVHELLEFARLFALPMTWFLVPAEDQADERLDLYGLEHGRDLLHFVFGTGNQTRIMRERFEEFRKTNPDAAADAARRLEAPTMDEREWDERQRVRSTALEALLTEGTSDVEKAIDEVHFAITDLKHKLAETRRSGGADTPPR